MLTFLNMLLHYITLLCMNIEWMKKKWKNKSLRTCFTCMSPGVCLKVVRPRELSLTRLAFEGFNS